MYDEWDVVLYLDKPTYIRMTSQWELSAIENKIEEILSFYYQIKSVVLYGNILTIVGTGNLVSREHMENAIQQLL